MSFLDTYRRSIGMKVGAAALSLAGLVGAARASADVVAYSAPHATPVASAPVSRAVLLPPLSSPSELASAPHAYYVPAGAHASGAFGSQWRLDMLLRNSAPIGTPPADVVLYAHPRGQAASPSDPSYAFALPAGASVWLPDVLGTISSDPLAAWVEARSTSPLSINEAYIHNLASTGDKTGSALPVFNAATLDSDQRLLREGDKVEFLLIGAARHARENNIIWNAPTSCPAVATPTLIDQLGNQIAVGATIQVPPGAYVQQTVDEAVGTTVSLGNVLRTTIRCEQGSTTPLQAWNGVTQINTLNPQYQDSIILQGTKHPLLESASYTTLPAVAEVNDPVSTSVQARVRSGAIIESVAYDIDGDGHQDGPAHQGNGTNTYTENTNWTALAPFTTTKPQVRLNISEEGRNYFIWTQGTPWDVSAEKDGYVATKADAQAYVMANLTEASYFASRGSLNTKMYSSVDWKAMWPTYFDGVSSATNPEAKSVTFNDVGNGHTSGGNFMVLELEDGQRHGVGGLPEAYIDALRTKMKAKLPQ